MTDIEEKDESRKELISLVEIFLDDNDTTSREDIVKAIAENLIYKNPYKNRIVFKTSFNDLKLCLHEYGKDHKGSYNRIRNIIELNKNYSYDLYNLFESIGHEYTHFMQNNIFNSNLYQKFNKRPIFRINPLASKIIDSQHNTFDQIKIREFSTLAIDNDNSRKEIIEKIEKMKKSDKNNFQYLSYLSLLFEKNARLCGFEFSKEILDCLLNDPNCTQKLKTQLLAEKKKLSKDWEKETESNNKLNEYHAFNPNSFDIISPEFLEKNYEIIKNIEPLEFMRRLDFLKLDEDDRFVFINWYSELRFVNNLDHDTDIAQIVDEQLILMLNLGSAIYNESLMNYLKQNKNDLQAVKKKMLEAINSNERSLDSLTAICDLVSLFYVENVFDDQEILDFIVDCMKDYNYNVVNLILRSNCIGYEYYQIIKNKSFIETLNGCMNKTCALHQFLTKKKEFNREDSLSARQNKIINNTRDLFKLIETMQNSYMDKELKQKFKMLFYKSKEIYDIISRWDEEKLMR